MKWNYLKLQEEILNYLKSEGYLFETLDIFENSYGEVLEVQAFSSNLVYDPLNLIISNDEEFFQLDEERVLNCFFGTNTSYECYGDELIIHIIG